jgi:hypothetical protein
VKRRDHESPADRAKAIVDALRAGTPTSVEVFEAFGELDELPVDAVREALASWMGPLPDPERLDAATRRAHGLPPRPLRLVTLATADDADILDLGPVPYEQIRLAGTSWDGATLDPEERLDGEVEGSFAGTLQRRVLADAENADTPLFDVLLFAGAAGIVFAAGTTKQVALIAYGKAETRDRRIARALEEALATPLPTRALAHEAAAGHARAATAPASAAFPPEPAETAAAAPTKPKKAKTAAAKKRATLKQAAAAAKKEPTATKKGRAAAKKAGAKAPATKTAPAKTAAPKAKASKRAAAKPAKPAKPKKPAKASKAAPKKSKR